MLLYFIQSWQNVMQLVYQQRAPFPFQLFMFLSPVFSQVAEVEKEKQDLIKQLNEVKARCDDIEKREAEKRQAEEKKFTEEINSLKRTNQQLKVHVSLNLSKTWLYIF